MNRTELCTRIAARPSLSGADAAAAVEAVIPATASPLERAGAVNIAGLGNFTDRHAQRAGAETRAPRKHPPSPPVPCRHSRPARPFATGATIGRARPAIGWFPHGRRDRSHDRRPPAIAAPPAAGEPRLQSRCSAFGTFVAGRNWGETLQFATDATARARKLWTADPSRAGVLIWRAAGLLRRQRCGPVRAGDAPSATEPLSTAAGRAPGQRPEATRGNQMRHDLAPRTTLDRWPQGQPAAHRRAAIPSVHSAPRTASSTAFHSASLRSCRERSAKPLDNFRRIAEHWLRTRDQRAPMTRLELYARVAARTSPSKADIAAALGAFTSTSGRRKAAPLSASLCGIRRIHVIAK